MSDDAKDPRFLAAIDLIGRAGAKSVQIRYSEDERPTVWMVVGEFPTLGDGWQFEAAGALTPLRAAMRLLEAALDGGTCAHCRRPSGIWEDWSQTPPLHELLVCWYVFDPETSTFRRSCEGETSGRHFGRNPKTGMVVRRNDPCPCESGRKYKHCHGR